jgi:hypothetical protein
MNMNAVDYFRARIGQIVTQTSNDRDRVRGKIGFVEVDGDTIIVHFEWMEEMTESCGWSPISKRDIKLYGRPPVDEVDKTMARLYIDHQDVLFKFEPCTQSAAVHTGHVA